MLMDSTKQLDSHDGGDIEEEHDATGHTAEGYTIKQSNIHPLLHFIIIIIIIALPSVYNGEAVLFMSS